jgi:hypothetical protein
MSRKKSKKVVKKVITSGVRRVLSTFDDVFMEPELKRFLLLALVEI